MKPILRRAGGILAPCPAAPRRWPAGGGRAAQRRAGPEFYGAQCRRPLPWALGGGLRRGWGRRLACQVRASRVSALLRVSTSSCRAPVAPLGGVCRCLWPDVVADGRGGRGLTALGAPGGPAGARSWCGAPSVGVSRLLLSFPRLPWLSRVLPASPRGAGPSWVVVVGVGGDGRRRVVLSDPTLTPRGALSGLIVKASPRRPRCSGCSSRGGSSCGAGVTCRRASAAPSV